MESRIGLEGSLVAGRFRRNDDLWKSNGRSRGASSVVGASLLGLVIVYGLGIWTGASLQHRRSAQTNTSVQTMPASPSTGGLSGSSGQSSSLNSSTLITSIYNQVKDSIFTITAVSTSAQNGTSEDIGTGFLINTNGDIATNAHVVAGQKHVTVTQGNHTYAGLVVDADKFDDLAIVHIDAPANLHPLSLGTVSSLQPGNLVIAIGNPFQLTESVSSGIVSGLNRSMPTQTGHVMGGLIQTDAALNPGNSGGPLLNAQGQVVGINTAIESPVQGSVGIGFAIPIDRLQRLLPTLLAGQGVAHPWLGIAGITIDPALAQQYHLPITSGAYVTTVAPGSPAAKAGLVGDSGTTTSSNSNSTANSTSGSVTDSFKWNGDYILAVNGKSVTSMDELSADIGGYGPGDKVHLTLARLGQKKTVTVTLASWPGTN